MKLPLFAATTLLLLGAMPASAADIHVFTDRAHPVSGVPAKTIVTELDAGTRLEDELGAGLPGDASQAAALVQRRLEKGGAQLQRQLAEAYQGVAEAWSLGVAKLPAVVVGHRYVVYGEPDVAAALSSIARYRKERP
ncbi:TIGR03757 family integrating conjugative element protein [Pseudomonas aeruginosa]